MLNAIMTGVSLFNAVKGNKRADAADDRQSALTSAEIARNNKIMELYGEGSSEMKSTMDGLLGEFGDYAQVSPENFVALRDYFSEARKSEELQNDNEVYSQDNIARSGGATTFDMAPQIDAVAQKFIDARMANTGRAIDENMSRQTAELMSRGMDNSTLDVQLRRSAADMKAQAYNQAMLDGVNDALTYVQGVQGVSSNEQLMDLSERRFGQNLIQNSDAMVNNSALADYQTGNSVMNDQSSMYTDYAARMGELKASPYKFAADGQTSAGFGNALSASNNFAERANNNANDAGGSFGTWLDRLTGYNDRKTIK